MKYYAGIITIYAKDKKEFYNKISKLDCYELEWYVPIVNIQFTALVVIPAECEDDFMEQIDALENYELEWWKQIKGDDEDDK